MIITTYRNSSPSVHLTTSQSNVDRIIYKRILFDYNHSPQADTSMGLNKLYLTLCKLETTYPEGAFIVAGDFNKANLKTRLPKLYQQLDCATRAGKTLDHCYSNFRDAYKALPRPPFGKADHDSILLLPAYLFNGISLGIQISKGPSCSSYRFHLMSTVFRNWLRLFLCVMKTYDHLERGSLEVYC